jgi:hypothetical protein
MIPKLFLILLALVIPAFFVLIFVMSGYHKLAALRRRCQLAWEELQVAPESSDPQRRRQEYDDAVSAYDRARQTVPGRWFATIFKFAPIESHFRRDSPTPR